MWSVLNENPTREKIILLLKKRGPLAIDELSRELSITSMGIRQHLLSLERRGLIEYITKRRGIGRPAFLYKLTKQADSLFPKEYDKFIINIFRDIEKHDGRQKIEEILKWRKTRMVKEAREVLADKKSMHDKLEGLKDILESDGYLAELAESDTHFTLKLFNCPIFGVASEFKEICRYDLQIMKDLVGKEISREECILDGNPSCTYTMPKVV